MSLPKVVTCFVKRFLKVMIENIGTVDLLKRKGTARTSLK